MTVQLPTAHPTLVPKGRIGRFVLEREIGKGSVGIVYLFRDPLIGRKVAIKVLNPQISPAQRQLFEKHFIQEARAAGRLNHPNIVTVYDADKSDDALYIVMEYLEGKELRDLLASGHQFNYKQIADMIGRIANALDYAHENGVIHRDIKPANIFITTTGAPKVLDFGIALASRQLSDADATFGQDQVADRRLMGTPNYMSPEQTKGGEVDARSDIFSLGVVLYQLLCGELPFKGADVEAILQAIGRDPAIPPQEIKNDVPLRLARIAAKALAKKPADRYQRASDMARDLNRFLEKERTDRLIAKIQQPEQDRAEKANAGKDAQTKSGNAANTNGQRAGLAAIVIALILLGLWLAFKPSPPITSSVTPPATAASNQVAAISQAQATDTAAEAHPPETTPAEIAANDAANTAANTAAINAASNAASNAADSLATKAKLAAEQKAQNLAKLKQAKLLAAPTVNKGEQAATTTGLVIIAVSPWGEVFVDGQAKGVAPPLSSLNLTVGKHKVEIRNGEDSHVVNIEVNTEKEVKVSHRF